MFLKKEQVRILGKHFQPSSIIDNTYYYRFISIIIMPILSLLLLSNTIMIGGVRSSSSSSSSSSCLSSLAYNLSSRSKTPRRYRKHDTVASLSLSSTPSLFLFQATTSANQNEQRRSLLTSSSYIISSGNDDIMKMHRKMSLVPSSSLSSVRSLPPLCSSSSSSSFSTSTTTTIDDNNNDISLLSNRLYGLDSPTVWQEFSPLSVQYNSINLGQGFPDWEPPMFVKDCMYESIYNDNMNQYARSYSHLPLAVSLAEDYNERYQKVSNNNDIPIIDPGTMIATAVGCTNVLYCALQGLLNPGDEVILFEPSFDIYTSQVRMAGGIPIFVPLRNPPSNNHNNDNTILQNANDQFIFDVDELEASITSKTKIILLNTPHNPTGKMFTKKELQDIANIVHKYPHITVISDEVYEHIVFQDDDNNNNNDNIIEHISIATVSGMFDKTLTLSSSGKTFSCTGWKVGWAIGPQHLIKAITAVQQWVNYSAPTPNQHAISKALQIAKQPYEHINEPGKLYNNYYHWLASDYQRKRSLLVNALQVAGMKPIIPQGGFFIMADTSNIEFPYETIYQNQYTDAMPKLKSNNNNIIMPRDWALSRWLTEVVGVTAIPPSAFYSLENVHLAQNYLRFAFCKNDDTILKATERFTKYFK